MVYFESKRIMNQELIDTSPELCITAGELRAMGCCIPQNIPDCAWISRASLKYNVGNAYNADDEPTVYHIPIEIDFLEPFKWIDVNITIEKENK
jgi:hypothetical protein